LTDGEGERERTVIRRLMSKRTCTDELKAIAVTWMGSGNDGHTGGPILKPTLQPMDIRRVRKGNGVDETECRDTKGRQLAERIYRDCRYTHTHTHTYTHTHNMIHTYIFIIVHNIYIYTGVHIIYIYIYICT
jgi:hypothetical protein